MNTLYWLGKGLSTSYCISTEENLSKQYISKHSTFGRN